MAAHFEVFSNSMLLYMNSEFSGIQKLCITSLNANFIGIKPVHCTASKSHLILYSLMDNIWKHEHFDIMSIGHDIEVFMFPDESA